MPKQKQPLDSEQQTQQRTELARLIREADASMANVSDDAEQAARLGDPEAFAIAAEHVRRVTAETDAMRHELYLRGARAHHGDL